MRNRRITALIVGLLLVVTACTDSAGEQDDTTTTVESTTTSADDATSTSEPPEETAGGDVRFAVDAEFTDFNPVTSATAGNARLTDLHWRRLVEIADGDWTPGLSESWEVSDDARTWTFNLREASWSDGEPFTAEDVIFTVEAYLNPATASPWAGNLTPIEGADAFVDGSASEISGISAPDDQTVVFELSEPDAGYIVALLNFKVLPRHALADLDQATWAEDPFFVEPPVGMGPYVFSRWVTDDQIEFVANPNYWVTPQLDRIFVQLLTTDVARAQLQTGEIDATRLASLDAVALEDTEGVTVHTAEGIAAVGFLTTIDNGKLGDFRVRQAILYAIDRQAIVEEVLGGVATVVETPLFRPTWAVPDDLIEYNYDPDRAVELLNEAGWDFDTPINLQYIPGNADRDAVITIAAGQLQQIGLNAQLVPMEAAQVTEALTDTRDLDLFITRMNIEPGTEPRIVNQFLMCDQASPAGVNNTRYCNEDLDAALIAGATTGDQDERAQHYQEANRIINEQVPYFPIYVEALLWGTTERLVGFDPTNGLGGAAEWSLSE